MPQYGPPQSVKLARFGCGYRRYRPKGPIVTLDGTSEVSMGSMVMGVGSAPPQARFEGVLFLSISKGLR